MLDTPEGAARELKVEMVEVLKLLNRIEEEHGNVEGLERDEIVHLLQRSSLPGVAMSDTDLTLRVLLANKLARQLSDVAYAWDRGREVGERFAITLDGKRLLLKELEKVNRV
ncbi:MAG TPA: hypothetical protein VMF04_04485 [Thermoplasmata archaeon]|nr:hypothetical protein [Thermoplasmata archaeon]